MSDAPKKIYLQDAGDYESAAPFEVTWCVDPQDDGDTAYVRADLIRDAIIAGMRIATNTPITMVTEAIQDAINEIMGGKND